MIFASFYWQCESFISGSVAILWFVAWSLIVKEAPVDHKSISQEELEYIHQNIGYGSEQTKVCILWPAF